jgi:hypothetical protein
MRALVEINSGQAKNAATGTALHDTVHIDPSLA